LHEFYLAAIHLRTAFAEVLAITLNEAAVLEELAKHGGRTPEQIAALLRLTASGVSRLADRLERRGYLRRERRPEHAGRILLIPTELTRATADRLLAPFVADMTRLTASLSPAEIDLITRFVHQVTDVQERHARRLAVTGDSGDRERPEPAGWG
jgi:DNA-binding MarR family transcriptional regulator